MSYFIIQEDGSVVSSYDTPVVEVINVNPDSVCGQMLLNQPEVQQQNTTEGE